MQKLQSVAKSVADYVCPDCQHMFCDKNALTQHRKNKHPISSTKLTRFVEERGGACYYCDRMVSLEDNEHGTGASRDHIVPVTLNGTNAQANLLLACKRCNELRGHAQHEAFKRLIQGDPVTRAELWPHLFGESE